MAKDGLSDRNLIRAIKANVAKGKMTDAQFRHFIMESLELLDEPATDLDDKRRQEILETALSYAYSNSDDVNTAFQTEEDEMLLVRGRLVAPFDENDFKRVLAELDEPDGVQFTQAGKTRHLLVTVEWDTTEDDEGKPRSLDGSGLSEQVLVLDVPFYWRSEEHTEVLSNLLTDTFGYCHHGFTVEVIEGPIKQPTIVLMVSWPKD